jgi:hypothetical protein
LAGADPATVEVDDSARRVFESLQAGTPEIRPVAAASLRDGLDHALDQVFAYANPLHPDFRDPGEEVRLGDLRHLWGMVERASDGGGRVPDLSARDRAVGGRLAGPLGLGSVRENVYTVDRGKLGVTLDGKGPAGWAEGFDKAVGQSVGGDGVSAGRLRESLADFGMNREMEDLLILAWGLLDNREWSENGHAIDAPEVGKVHDRAVVAQADLPDAETWDEAHRRARGLFGIKSDERLTAASLGRFAAEVARAASSRANNATSLVARLNDDKELLGLNETPVPPRLATARLAEKVTGGLSTALDPLATVKRLAAFALPNELAPLRKSMEDADDVTEALGSFDPSNLEAAQDLPGGEDLKATLQQDAQADQLTADLVKTIRKVAFAANTVLQENARRNRPAPVAPAPTVPGRTPVVAPATPAVPVPTDAPWPGDQSGAALLTDAVASQGQLGRLADRVKAILTENPRAEINVSWTVVKK